ncbi:hypothetical protein MLD38_033808 [Melastoma candidum]|uniref:Uncharacterized protein n=1 Tax=Melastoma candidum TaxID=119954 RepID=A0ACB9MA19_9MYRT|nr:hypothetical protein MLD38_033808 [Melastoma candidum]
MELRHEHGACLGRLRHISEDIASLRAENNRLRSANARLLEILAGYPGGGVFPNYGLTSAAGYNHQRYREGERPGPWHKSVSVRSRMDPAASSGQSRESLLIPSRGNIVPLDVAGGGGGVARSRGTRVDQVGRDQNVPSRWPVRPRAVRAPSRAPGVL